VSRPGPGPRVPTGRRSGGNVLLPRAGRKGLEDTLALLSDRAALEEIDQGRQDVAEGKAVTAEELRAKYLRG
jgi:hypothetical protein